MAREDWFDYLDRYQEGWAENDTEKVLAQFVDGGTYLDPTLDEPISGAELADHVEGLNRGFPDVRFEEHRRVTTEEDGLVVFEWTMHGTHTGTFEGLPPTGREITLEGVDVAVVTDEGIESIRGYFDQQAVTEQLGLTFPEVLGQLPTLARGAIRNAL